MKEYLTQLVSKYGWLVLGGLVGAVVHRIRNSMSLKRFMGVLVVSGFVGFSVGIIMKNYLSASEEVIFVTCSVCGVFSQDILNEIQELISYLSVFIKNKFNIK